MKTFGCMSALLLVFVISKNGFCQSKSSKTKPDTVHIGGPLKTAPVKADSDSLDVNFKPSSPTLPSPNNPNPHHPEPNPVNPNRPVVPDTTVNLPVGPIKPAGKTKK